MAKDKSAKRRRSAVIYTPVAVLLIAVIAIFGISVFFRITVIEVSGAEKYTVEQIRSVSGIREGGNLIFVNREAAARAIGLNLPYLSEVTVTKVIPNKIVIRVTESKPLAVINAGGDWWIIDQKARVLEKTEMSGLEGRIMVTGLTPVTAGVGVALTVVEQDRTKLRYLTDVLSALESAGMAGDVTALDVSNIAYISFDYAGRFTVRFGSGENASTKLVRLSQIVAQLEDGERGTIDLSGDGDAARFIPE